MPTGHIRFLAAALVFNCFISVLAIVLPEFSASINTYAQSAEKVRPIPSDFISEQGCPVTLSASRTELDLDPFDSPIDARLYFSYRNVSARPVAAVKFRVRFIDNTGKDLGTFQAPDGALLEPGGERSQKWKTDRVYPGAVALKVRVLEVKYADGSLWQSAKMQEIPRPDSGS